MLNDYFDELAENITLNTAFDQIEANKPKVYIKLANEDDDEYQITITGAQNKQYAIKKLIYKYPCGCSEYGNEIMHIKHIPKLLGDLVKDNIAIIIEDQKELARRLRRNDGREKCINYDREGAEYSRRLRCIADQEYQEHLAGKKAEETRAYLSQASKPHESLNYFDNLSSEIILKSSTTSRKKSMKYYIKYVIDGIKFIAFRDTGRHKNDSLRIHAGPQKIYI